MSAIEGLQNLIKWEERMREDAQGYVNSAAKTHAQGLIRVDEHNDRIASYQRAIDFLTENEFV